jgi:hypothetical protein
VRNVFVRSDVYRGWNLHDEWAGAVLAIRADGDLSVGSDLRERIVLRCPVRVDVLHDGFDVHP